jgi:hypothetical protein
MCYDWRVLTALAVLGVGIFLVAPGIALAALPLLILAACPLSMIIMMKSMGGHQASAPEAAAEPATAAGSDRVAALRGELAELGRRQERLAAELAAVDAAESRQSAAPAEVAAAHQGR